MKSKYERRRAIDCKLLEKSKNHKGYCKYLVTIAEMDGTIHKQPCYGKDMQDAVSRLVNTERTVRVEKKIEKNVGWVALIWIGVMGWPAFFTNHDTPLFIVYSFTSVILMFLLAAWWYNYINKKD